MRHQVRLHLGHEIHGHHHNDQQRGAAEIKRYVPLHPKELREQAYGDQIDRTDRGQACEHEIDILRRLSARPDPGDESPGLLQIVCGLARIEHDCGVEEAEECNQSTEHHQIDRRTRRQLLRNLLQPTGLAGLAKPGRNRGREQHQRRGEDRRDDAGHIDLQRQVSRLVRVRLATLPLGIINRNPALTAFHEHDERGNRERQYQQKQHHDRVELAGPSQLQGATDCRREAGNNACKDDDRNTVTDAALGDLLTQPHQKHRSGGQGDDCTEQEPGAGNHDHRQPGTRALALQRRGNTEGLEQGQHHGEISRVLSDLAAP